MSDSEHDDCPNNGAPGPALIRKLVDGAEFQHDEREWRRHVTREDSEGVIMLEIRRGDGPPRHVRLQNVSDTGMCIISRAKLELDEVVSVRLVEENASYERFHVTHVTGTLGGFKVGLAAIKLGENRQP